MPLIFDAMPQKIDMKKVSLLIRFCLLFIKKQARVEGDFFKYNVYYKVFQGKEYILYSNLCPPMGWNCRCAIDKLDLLDKLNI
jgi:hypothetical protein